MQAPTLRMADPILTRPLYTKLPADAAAPSAWATGMVWTCRVSGQPFLGTALVGAAAAAAAARVGTGVALGATFLRAAGAAVDAGAAA